MKLLVKKLKKISKTATIKDTGIVFFGQLIWALISALFFFLIARVLGPAKLGIYTTVTAVVIMVTDTVDLSLDSSIVRFIGLKEKKSYLKFAFLLKVMLGAFFFLLLFSLARSFSLVLRQEISLPLKIASFLVFVIFLYRLPRAIFQGEKKFVKSVGLDIGASLLRLAFLLFFIFAGSLTVNNVFWLQIVANFILFLIGIKMISLDFLKARISSQVRGNFFSFQGWLTLAFVLVAIHSRIDTLFLMRFSGPEMVGFYQAGYRFFLPVNQFSSVLSIVFAPRFASFKKEIQAKAYLKKAALLASGFAFLLLGFIFFAPFFINFFYGLAYKAAILPTQILSLGFFAFVMSVPFTSYLLYRKGQTKFFALANFFQVVLIITLDLVFIPKMAATGAALATAISFVVINLLIIIRAISS